MFRSFFYYALLPCVCIPSRLLYFHLCNIKKKKKRKRERWNFAVPSKVSQIRWHVDRENRFRNCHIQFLSYACILCLYPQSECSMESKLDAAIEWQQNYSRCLQVHASGDEWEESCCRTLLINSMLLINVTATVTEIQCSPEIIKANTRVISYNCVSNTQALAVFAINKIIF